MNDEARSLSSSTPTNVQNDLMTAQELADHYNCSLRWMQLKLKEWNVETNGYRKNDRGRDTPLYSLVKCELKSSHFADASLVNQLSEASKLIFAKGILVKDASIEQLQALVEELYITAQQQEQKLIESNERMSWVLHDLQGTKTELGNVRAKYETKKYSVGQARDIIGLGGFQGDISPLKWDKIAAALVHKGVNFKFKWTDGLVFEFLELIKEHTGRDVGKEEYDKLVDKFIVGGVNYTDAEEAEDD